MVSQAVYSTWHVLGLTPTSPNVVYTFIPGTISAYTLEVRQLLLYSPLRAFDTFTGYMCRAQLR